MLHVHAEENSGGTPGLSPGEPVGRGTQRWLVRFGYDGRQFGGWAQQPGLRTVEGEILRGLLPYTKVVSSGGPSLDVASRTDRGVSARGNALTVLSALPGPALLRALNALSPQILFTAARPVGAEFRVRHALERRYRYFEPPDREARRLSPAAWNAAAALFRGRIDVRSFGRRLPLEKPCWRDITGVRVRSLDRGLCLELVAPSFVWGEVRKIVGALREHARGRLPLARLAAAVRGRERLTLPLAEPQGLVLWEVRYGVPWKVRWPGPNRHQTAHLERTWSQQWVHERLAEALPGAAASR